MTKSSQSTKQQRNLIVIDFESLKKEHWSDQELANAKLVTEFVQLLMNNHNFDIIKEKYSNNPYKQHNRGIADGISGVLATVTQLSKRFPDYTYDVKNIFADGNYVSFHSHATINEKHRGNDKKGFNIKDTWRIEDGKLVEHWDAVQPIDTFMRFYTWLTGGNIRNSNGVF